MNAVARIALGTAQFGMDYGIANCGGRTSTATARAVLDCARGLGISWLDTAAAYGDAESVIGEIAGTDSSFRVGTKVLAANGGGDPLQDSQREFSASLTRLKRDRLDALLIHDARNLLGWDGQRIFRWLVAQRDDGRVESVGASVYDGATAKGLLRRFRLDWIQLPLSVLDQRCLSDGTLAELKSAGVRIQIRSVLLQGLLLVDPARVPSALAAATVALARLRTAAAEARVSPLQVALGFVASLAEVDLITLGVESASQLKECAAAMESPAVLDWRRLSCADPEIVDPRRWPPGLRLAA